MVTPNAHWNLRIVRHEIVGLHGESLYTFALHECHYTDGVLLSVTKEPVKVIANSIEDLKWYLERCKEALDKPVLDDDTLEEIKDD